MLQIYIGPKKIAANFWHGLSMSVHPLFVVKSRTLSLLETTEKLDLRGSVVFAYRRQILSVPKQYAEAAVSFLKRYHAIADPAYTCYSFACEANGVTRHPLREMLAYWNTKPLHRARVGQTVFLCAWRDKHYFKHAALNIGKGLYLSVYGSGGHLHVSTLEDMKKDFNARRVYLATPRKP
jgi:hypothetical protein